MSTHIFCRDCGEFIERYEDDEPYQEVDEQCEACRRRDLNDADLEIGEVKSA